MEYLVQVHDDFEQRINDIVAIGDINAEILKIASNNLKSLKADLQSADRNIGVITKIDRQLVMYSQVSRLPEIKRKYPIVREQIVVLIIGAIEAYIGDLFRSIADNEPHKLHWEDENEKISFDPALLQKSFTLGDAIVGHLKAKKISFQDLQSSLQAMKKYLNVEPNLSNELRDNLILAAAHRNIIVHNKSTVDLGFLRQIRDTTFGKNYSSGRVISLDDQYIELLRLTALEFAALLHLEILEVLNTEL